MSLFKFFYPEPLDPEHDLSDACFCSSQPSEQHGLLQRFNKWKIKRSFIGWRFSLRVGAISAVLVFLLNTAALVWTIVSASAIHEGRAVLFEGSCSAVRSYNTWLHFYINIASTLLTTTSNFSMQCLSAPTREDIDRAHQKKIWMDIGVPSLRNLRHIHWYRSTLWATLATTSMIIHLLSNATVFSTIGTSSYGIYSVDRGTFKSNKSDVLLDEQLLIGMPDFPYPIFTDSNKTVDADGVSYVKTRLKYYNRDECIDVFGKPFISDYRFLFLEVPDSLTFNKTWFVNATSPLINKRKEDCAYSTKGSYVCSYDKTAECVMDPYQWMCTTNSTPGPCEKETPCNLAQMKSASTWKPFNKLTTGCYSYEFEESCRLEMAAYLAITVLAIMLVKVLVLVVSAFHGECGGPIPILTIGDAISSFLGDPDPNTARMSFTQFGDMVHQWAWHPAPKFWLRHRQRRMHATSPKRRKVFLAFTVCLLLEVDNVKGDKRISSLANTGLGSVNLRCILDNYGMATRGATAVWGSTIIANAAQPILALYYFIYNGFYTAIVLGEEWDAYGTFRKGMRVSSIPRGAQRGTHFLQLPFRFALPLILTSSLLHWLASQSLFAVSINIDEEEYFFTCGYSPSATFCLLITFLVTMVYFWTLALRKFQNGLPVVGSCSAAIAAACHAPSTRVDLSLAPTLPLQWGVVRGYSDDSEAHCAFWHEEVYLPEQSMTMEHWIYITRRALFQKWIRPRALRGPFPGHPASYIPTSLVIHQPGQFWERLEGNLHASEDAELSKEVWSRVMYNAWNSKKSGWYELLERLFADDVSH